MFLSNRIAVFVAVRFMPSPNKLTRQCGLETDVFHSFLVPPHLLDFPNGILISGVQKKLRRSLFFQVCYFLKARFVVIIPQFNERKLECF